MLSHPYVLYHLLSVTHGRMYTVFDLEHAIQSTLWGEPETAAEAESWQGLGTKVNFPSCGHSAALQHPCARDSLPCIEGRAFSNSVEVALMFRADRDAAALLALPGSEKG